MRILVPVDGSTHSRKALEFIATRKPLFGGASTVELANVQYSVPQPLMQLLGLEAVKSAYEEEGRKIFDAATKGLDFTGLELEEKVLYGDVGRTIAEEAEGARADLVVMGTRGLNPMKGLFLGSVSTSVLSQTKCPMLLVRGETPVPQTEALRVGIAVDGSEFGLAAIEYILGNTEFFGPNAKFEVIFVGAVYHDLLAKSAYMIDTIGPVLTEQEFNANQAELAKEAIEPALELFRTTGIEATGRVLEGDPAVAISEYAHRHLDMLVMGSHGRGNFTSAVLGSTAMHIAAATRLPLLIVRR